MAAVPPRRLDEARRKRAQEVQEQRAAYKADPLPSQNVQLEEKLLSILLYDGSLVPEVRHIFRFPDGVHVRPMYADINQRCWDEMLARYDAGELSEFETMYDAWVGDDPLKRQDERELLNKLRNMALADDTVLVNRERLAKQWANRLKVHAIRRAADDISTTAAGISHPSEEQAATGDPVDDLQKLAWKATALATAGAASDRFRLKSIPEIRQRPRKSWVVQGILQERGLWLVFGDSNTGKSFLSLDWGLCFATGTPWQGREMPQGHVVYVCAEGIDGLRDRLDAWLAHHGFDDAPNFHIIDDSPNLLESGDVLEVIAQIQALDTAPICVIFDTLADSMPGGDENSGEDYGIVISAMRRVQRECGCAVLTVHHTPLASGRPRGHGKLRAAMDTAIWVSRDEQTDDMVIRCDKQREKDKFLPFNLRLQSIALDDYGDVTSCVVVASDAPPPPLKPKSPINVNQRKMLLALAPEANGLTFTDWLRESGQTRSTFDRLRKDLEQDGYVACEFGRYTLTDSGRLQVPSSPK